MIAKRQRKGSKTRAEKGHARKRFLERFGIALIKSRRKKIITMIRSGQAELVKRESHRVSLYRMKDMVLVYDKQRKTIITAWKEARSMAEQEKALTLSELRGELDSGRLLVGDKITIVGSAQATPGPESEKSKDNGAAGAGEARDTA